MKPNPFFRRGAAILTALCAAFLLSSGVLAADTHYLINGVAGGSVPSSGKLRPSSGPARDAFGADHTSGRIGLGLVSEEMRSSAPNYYSGNAARDYKAPEFPAPKTGQAMTPGQLAQKYNITFIDKTGYLTGQYGADAVAILDAGLQAYSTEFVRTVVDKWAAQGRFFCINLHYPSASDGFKGATEIDDTAICINLVVPAGKNPGGISTGTVAHEFGHAVYLCLEGSMGKQNLARQWMALNGPYPYGSRDPGRAHAFVSDYGSQYYYEDPATIFEAFADAPKITAEKLSEKDYSLLLKKAEFLDECVGKYIGTPGTLFSAVWEAMPQ